MDLCPDHRLSESVSSAVRNFFNRDFLVISSALIANNEKLVKEIDTFHVMSQYSGKPTEWVQLDISEITCELRMRLPTNITLSEEYFRPELFGPVGLQL